MTGCVVTWFVLLCLCGGIVVVLLWWFSTVQWGIAFIGFDVIFWLGRLILPVFGVVLTTCAGVGVTGGFC